jgi:hypothetical protein
MDAFSFPLPLEALAALMADPWSTVESAFGHDDGGKTYGSSSREETRYHLRHQQIQHHHYREEH